MRLALPALRWFPQCREVRDELLQGTNAADNAYFPNLQNSLSRFSVLYNFTACKLEKTQHAYRKKQQAQSEVVCPWIFGFMVVYGNYKGIFNSLVILSFPQIAIYLRLEGAKVHMQCLYGLIVWFIGSTNSFRRRSAILICSSCQEFYNLFFYLWTAFDYRCHYYSNNCRLFKWIGEI